MTGFANGSTIKKRIAALSIQGKNQLAAIGSVISGAVISGVTFQTRNSNVPYDVLAAFEGKSFTDHARLGFLEMIDSARNLTAAEWRELATDKPAPETVERMRDLLLIFTARRVIMSIIMKKEEYTGPTLRDGVILLTGLMKSVQFLERDGKTLMKWAKQSVADQLIDSVFDDPYDLGLGTQ